MNNKQKIKTITGHLTVLDKKAIKLLLAFENYQAKVNRKTYKIEITENNLFKVLVSHNESNDYGLMIQKSYLSTFEVK